MSKKCPHCNEYIPDEASFCMNCFNRISPIQTENFIDNKNNKKFFSKALITAITALLIICVCTALIFAKQINGDKNKQPSTTASSTATINNEITESIVTTVEKPKKTTTTTTTTTEVTFTNPPTEKSTTKKETTQPSGTLKYSSYGNGIIITSYSGNEGNIIIPNEIDGKTVIAVGAKAFSNNKYIKSITFEEGSSPKSFSIKPNAFNNLSTLTSLNLPSQADAENFTDCISKAVSLKLLTYLKNTLTPTFIHQAE